MLFGAVAPARGQVGQSGQPKLVLLLVIDQFCYDYLSRYNDKFSSNGFRYLEDHGANFVNCRYKQATTQTACGHSIIASGAYPWSTGVVANQWFDRRTNREVTSVSDDAAQLSGGNGAGASCRSLSGTTFGDQLKLSTNGRSKVFALSLKDRGALFLAGKLGNGAFWFDARTGSFVSSNQFGATLPTWVKTFNDRHYADQYYGHSWQRLLPETQYTASTRDDSSYEAGIPGDGKQFPHVITGGGSGPGESFYNAFEYTPWSNQMLLDLASEAMDKEGLGQHTDPDVLAVSLSATDRVGHAFGPYSQEAEDMLLRLDQSLGTFFQHINQKIGLNKCIVVLTGDHGAVPCPEMLKERGQSRGLDCGRIDPQAFKNALDSAMDARLGQEDWISAFLPPNVYLNLSAIDRQKYRQPEVEALAAKLAHSVSGVGDVYTAAQFYTNQLPNGPLADSVRRSYFWGRSGELYVIPKPGYIFSGEQCGTSHGCPYSYDAQVPMIMMGSSLLAGRYGQDSSPADIAPTISAILNITMPPLSEGRVLHEALGQFHGPPVPLMSAEAR